MKDACYICGGRYNGYAIIEPTRNKHILPLTEVALAKDDYGKKLLIEEHLRLVHWMFEAEIYNIYIPADQDSSVAFLRLLHNNSILRDPKFR